MNKRILARGPAAEKRFCIRVLIDVAWEPSVETGANVPGYSGGMAASMGYDREGPAAGVDGGRGFFRGGLQKSTTGPCLRSFFFSPHWAMT